jgi:glutaminyl-peptide cyclotransferase
VSRPPFRSAGLAIASALLLAAGPAGCGDGGSSTTSGPDAPAANAGAFDVDAAWDLIKLQVDAGQRPAGSPQLRRLATDLRGQMPDARFETIPGEPGLRNVVSVIPGTLPAVVIGAHYDTLVKPRGFVGANNGAAGTAIVVELARTLAAMDRPAGSPQVRFVLFDGEEPAAGLPEEQKDFYSAGLRGSRAYVAAHPNEVGAMILLDYVANQGLQLPREGTSTPSLWRELRAAAADAGASSYFPAGTGPPILDDHTPFLREGIPAIDLIDWSYEGHSISDRIDQLSPASADAVGETIVALIERIDEEATASP